MHYGDVCTIVGRIGFRGYTTDDLTNNPKDGAITLSPTNIVAGELDLSKPTYIKWPKYYESPEIMLEKDDIVIVKTGSSIGRTTRIREIKHPMTLNPQFVVLKDIKVDNGFLSYIIKSPLFQASLKAITVGSAIPTLSQKNLAKISINIPEEKTQKRISRVLSSLDDKIEVNRKMNENLEQQAMALFKSWFVDFEPFKNGEFVESELGMIPKGWRVGSLSSIADYINGLAMQKYRPNEGEKGLPVLKIKELGQGSCDINSELCSPSLIGDKYIINDGDIIFSWSGTLMVKVWCGGKCGLNQHLFVVVPKNYSKWYVYQWTKYHLDNFIRIAKDKAVTMGHIKRGELDKAKVVIPDSDNLTRIDALMEPIFNQIISNELESRRLSTLRDTLLPKLMSGELKVNEVEISEK